MLYNLDVCKLRKEEICFIYTTRKEIFLTLAVIITSLARHRFFMPYRTRQATLVMRLKLLLNMIINLV